MSTTWVFHTAMTWAALMYQGTIYQSAPPVPHLDLNQTGSHCHEVISFTLRTDILSDMLLFLVSINTVKKNKNNNKTFVIHRFMSQLKLAQIKKKKVFFSPTTITQGKHRPVIHITPKVVWKYNAVCGCTFWNDLFFSNYCRCTFKLLKLQNPDSRHRLKHF